MRDEELCAAVVEIPRYAWVRAQYRCWHHAAYATGRQAKGHAYLWLLCSWGSVKHLILVSECVETFRNLCENRHAVFYVLTTLRLQFFCESQKWSFSPYYRWFWKKVILTDKKKWVDFWFLKISKITWNQSVIWGKRTCILRRFFLGHLLILRVFVSNFKGFPK